MIVYSIDSRASFEEIQQYHNQILRVKDRDEFPMILVANKCDLEDTREISTQGNFRRIWIVDDILINLTEGEAMAKKLGARFIETSAKSRIRVDEAFHQLVRQIRDYNDRESGIGPGAKKEYANGNKPSQMHMDGEKEAGCCGKCIMM